MAAFVGRARELASARDAVDGAARGHGRAVVVTGEAGIGKTRFAHEVASMARHRGLEVVWTAGWPAGGAPTYWPWPEILDAIGPATGPWLHSPDTETERERFDHFRDVADVVWRRAAHGPLLVVVDDVQAVDADALLLTRFVAQGAASHPVVLLLTQRTGPDVPRPTVELLEQVGRSGTSCRLDELTPDEVADLIEGHGDRADDAVVRRVAELTGGVPFLVELVLDSGLHHRDGPIPDPARRLVADGLDRLSADQRSVIEAAAVLRGPIVPAALAAAAGTDAASVLTACRCATQHGVLRSAGPTEFAFRHELAREAVISLIPSTSLADLHGRCLRALDVLPRSADIASRRARHALELARCAEGNEAESIAILRDSARVLSRSRAPEAAAELLEAAAELQQAHTGRSAPLLVELGTALLTTGRLGDARPVFSTAIEVALADDDRPTLARAALGLGGMWVMEHRSVEEWTAYLDVLAHASAAVADDPGLSASLRLRMAAERAAAGDLDVAEVVLAVDGVRADGRPVDLMAGLSLQHHLMMGPRFAHDRAAVADELIALARSEGDDFQLVVGLLWRVADDVLVGSDPQRGLGELRARADALGMEAILFLVDAFEVMLRLRAGELDAAEKAATACHRRGVAVGDVDAETYLAAHLLTAHWYRGTAPALLSTAQATAASAAAPINNPVFTAVVAALAAEAGDVDAAEHALAVVGRDRLGDLVSGSTWLVTMFCVVEAAHHLADASLAESAYELLLPYESLPTMSAIGVSCFGSTARSLGMAARTAGRLDDAIAHLERAVAENQRFGNRPMVAIARADLAAALVDRHRADDRERASVLIARALDGANSLGLTGRIDAWTELQRRCQTPPSAPAVLERRDGGWRIAAGGEIAHLPTSTGLGYLSRLLESPGVEITVGELVGGHVPAVPQELLDPTAREQLRRRIADLESAIDGAFLRGDTDKAARLQAELDELVAHLKASAGPAGRSRRFDDASERARTSVQKALRRAIAAVSAECPHLGEALGHSVRTGYRCCYEPTAAAPATWEVRRG